MNFEKFKNELIEKKLFWEKYRPSSLEETIIPDRIRKLAENGIEGNYLFYGHSGCGKTSLVKILLKEYENRSLSLTSKLGIEELRTRVDRFCKEAIPFEDPNTLKVVFFEEFDRATTTLQEELKSFIEDNSKRVRFIASCNNINKIKSEVRSRFIEIDFTPIGDEAKILKTNFAKRVIEITKKENIEIGNEDLKKIINNRFPDFRKVWQDIQQYTLSGVNSSIHVSSDDEKLFEIILNKKNTIENWEYLYSNWSDKIDLAFQKLGREFFNWIKQTHPEKYNRLGSHIIILSDYTDLKLPNALDPFITLCALIFKLQEIFE